MPALQLPNGFRFGVGSLGSHAVEQAPLDPARMALLADLSVDSYRFSLPWARLHEAGGGQIKPAALAEFDQMVDLLCEAGIAPMVTLFDWNLPDSLADDGGWLNRATIDHFAEFAGVAGSVLADRVAHWVPLNEPNLVAMEAYALGDQVDPENWLFDVLGASHHLLVAHGRAVIELRATGAVSVGCANAHSPIWPASDEAAEVGATKLFDALWNGSWIEPLLKGRYPVDLASVVEPMMRDGDMATIRQPLDFYGVNFCSPLRIGVTDEGSNSPFQFIPLVGHARTDAGCAIVPQALREWLILMRARFRAGLPPLVITEVGSCWFDDVTADGSVHDTDRVDYLMQHLAAVAEAIGRGVEVDSFYAWSLVDQIWSGDPLSPPDGLVRLDVASGELTPKDSYRAYANLIAATRQL